MADSLRRLVNIGTFGILQEKLEKWLADYHIISCDQNVARCCEIIELNGRVQGQLFKLLSLCASDGGMYGGASVIRSRLLPWLGSGFFASGGSVTADTSLSVLAEVAAKDREIEEIQDTYERSVSQLEADLAATKDDNVVLQEELEDTKDELSRSQRQSTNDKMFSEKELQDLRAKYHDAQNEIITLRARASLVDEYERQIRRLKSEIAILRGSSSVGDLSESLNSYRYLPRVSSPLAPDDATHRVRQSSAITRYNDLFSRDRIDAMDTLRRYSDDHENNQRIVMSAMQEAFTAAKLAFQQFKSKVRSNLAATHYGPETLEEAVQDYINRNTDLYDLPLLVSDVIRGLNRNLKISLPFDVNYTIINPFIREACKLAWQMSSLAHPLDISLATDAELFDDNKYRRSYDSEYTAPLVNHHVWPCLMQGIRIITKGECVTRRGASLMCDCEINEWPLPSSSRSFTIDRSARPHSSPCAAQSSCSYVNHRSGLLEPALKASGSSSMSGASLRSQVSSQRSLGNANSLLDDDRRRPCCRKWSHGQDQLWRLGCSKSLRTPESERSVTLVIKGNKSKSEKAGNRESYRHKVQKNERKGTNVARQKIMTAKKSPVVSKRSPVTKKYPAVSKKSPAFSARSPAMSRMSPYVSRKSPSHRPVRRNEQYLCERLSTLSMDSSVSSGADLPMVDCPYRTPPRCRRRGLDYVTQLYKRILTSKASTPSCLCRSRGLREY